MAALWGLGALIVFAVGAATLALQCVFGIAGIGVAVLLVVIAGNPSAGGALPPPLLPPFWAAIGPALPPGAGVWVARSIAYFEGRRPHRPPAGARRLGNGGGRRHRGDGGPEETGTPA